MEYKLELVAVPVSDVDRAKEFYVRAGFNPAAYPATDRIPLAVRIRHRRFLNLHSPHRKGCGEVGSNLPAARAIRDMPFERSAPGIIRRAVSFSEDLMLCLAAVHAGRKIFGFG